MVDRTLWHPRFCALIMALLLYAGLSSPTPDRPGLIEGVIALLLVVASLPGAAAFLAELKRAKTLWLMAGGLLLLYGLVVPLVMGLLRQNDLAMMLRDIVPFLYLFLPLFLGDLFIGQPKRAKILLVTGLLMGGLFSVRFALHALSLGAGQLNFAAAGELIYLANAPIVLLGACAGFYMLCLWAQNISFSPKALGMALVGGFMLALCAAAMGLTLQRASLGWLALYGVACWGLCFIRKPGAGLFVLAALLCLLTLLSQDIVALAQSLLEKTRQHGLNMRAQEWAAIAQEASAHPLNMLLGQGWGAGFLSPATDMTRVNFTHNLLSALWLKAGLIGAGLGALYLAALARMGLAGLRYAPLLLLALAGPIIIASMLYGSYKSLDFGFMLLLLCASLLAPMSNAPESRSC